MSATSKASTMMRLFFPGLGLLAIGLGLWGFLEAPAAWPQWHAAIINTLQIFVLNVSPDDINNVPAQIAAFLAPAATIGTAAFAFGACLRHAAWITWLRLRPATHVFLGNGDTAAAIARQLIRRGATCVGVDQVKDTPFTRALELEAGNWFVFCGDARSTDELAQVNTGGASNIWVLTGDDIRNFEVARGVSDLCRREHPNRGPTDPPTYLRVLVNDRQLIRARHHLLEKQPGVDIEFISILRAAARALLRKHPPPALVPPSSLGDPFSPSTRIHIAVIGDSPFSEAIVVQAITHLVLGDKPDELLHVSLIGRHVDALHQRLMRTFPALDPASSKDPEFDALLPLAKLTVHCCEPSELMPANWRSIQEITPFDVVYVACEQDLHTINAATRIAALRDIVQNYSQTIVACVRQRNRVDAKRVHAMNSIWSEFPVFDMGVEAVARTGKEDPDRQAKRVHLYYDDPAQLNQNPMETDKAAENAWRSSASHEDRWSSRLASDHFEIKLALSGLPSSELGTDKGKERLAELEDRLMRIEHRRFIIERLLDGWLPLTNKDGAAPSSGLSYNEQKSALRLNRTLVPFQALPESEREKDRAVIMAMRAILLEATKI